jgi:hypothetical protein
MSQRPTTVANRVAMSVPRVLSLMETDGAAEQVTVGFYAWMW